MGLFDFFKPKRKKTNQNVLKNNSKKIDDITLKTETLKTEIGDEEQKTDTGNFDRPETITSLLEAMNQAYALYREKYSDAYLHGSYYFNDGEHFKDKFFERCNYGKQYQIIMEIIKQEPELDWSGRSYNHEGDLKNYQAIIKNQLCQSAITDSEFPGKEYLVSYLKSLPKGLSEKEKQKIISGPKKSLIKHILDSKIAIFDLGVFFLLYNIDYSECLKILSAHPGCIFYQDMIIRHFLIKNPSVLNSADVADLESMEIIGDFKSSFGKYFGEFNESFWKARILHAIISRAFYMGTGNHENFGQILKNIKWIKKEGWSFPGLKHLEYRIDYRHNNDGAEPDFKVDFSYAVGPWWYLYPLFGDDMGMMLLGYYDICSSMEA